MAPGRGALIVFEGCDRAGKSTQAKMLTEALNKRNISVEQRAFPNRSTTLGMLIGQFLSKKEEFPAEAVHLMFSANRWECKDKILKSLQNGTSLVIDRYAGSGAAYAAATSKRCLNWCKYPDKGLPSPDIVIYLSVSTESQCQRSNWGDERFENTKLQSHVASNYENLMDETWSVIDANDDKLAIHSKVLQKVLNVIDKVKDQPIGELYKSEEDR